MVSNDDFTRVALTDKYGRTLLEVIPHGVSSWAPKGEGVLLRIDMEESVPLHIGSEVTITVRLPKKYNRPDIVKEFIYAGRHDREECFIYDPEPCFVISMKT